MEIQEPKSYNLVRNFYFKANVATPAGTIKKLKIVTPDSYDYITAIGVLPIDVSGDPAFLFGLRKNTEDIVDVLPHSFLVANTSVAPNNKLLSISESINKDSILEVVVETSQAMNAGDVISFSFVAKITNKAAYIEYNNRSGVAKVRLS